MSIISRMRKQKAVYWALSGVGNYGDTEYASAVEIDCRWDDETAEVMGPNGDTFISRAKVYVDRDVTVGGVLMLGELTDVTDANNPKNNSGAYEIRAFMKNPNFRATEFLRTAVL